MKMKLTVLASLCVLQSGMAFSAPNPASQDWVIHYVKEAVRDAIRDFVILTEEDWASACTSGNINRTIGCYGNAESFRFAKINRLTGGFLTVANINASHAPNDSIYIKAFYAGTNTPSTAAQVTVTLASGTAARCNIFLQQGTGLESIGQGAINTSVTNNDTAGPVVSHPITVASGSVIIPVYYGSGTFTPHQPLYLVCAGVDIADGSTATSLQGNITAV